jgi:hypothetical protein
VAHNFVSSIHFYSNGDVCFGRRQSIHTRSASGGSACEQLVRVMCPFLSKNLEVCKVSLLYVHYALRSFSLPLHCGAREREFRVEVLMFSAMCVLKRLLVGSEFWRCNVIFSS